ncbi:uncharacterized protein LOC134222293 [Armigeres subalbatus]|uniref:uncharacterized protein LOC134222293 n=1 Tax=Armigeres subalbatus TaxID=124917 RepID=UPI002ED1EA6E
MADTAKITFSKLNQQNWTSWKQRMEWLLEKEDLWEVVNAFEPDSDEETDEWRKKDRKARANIGLFLEESQFKLVQQSAKAMWNALKESHEKATMSTIAHYLSLLCGANMSESNCKKWLSMKSEANRSQENKGRNSKDKSVKYKSAHGAGSVVCFMAGGGLSNWIIEIGATCHMTGNRSFFAELNKSAVSSVILADGKKTSVRETGHGIVRGIDGQGENVEIKLKDVLYVPGLDGGLISVCQLDAKKFVIEFNERKCEIKSRAGDILVVGDKVGSLYQLRLAQGARKVSNCHGNCQHLWHRRIGHRDPDLLRVMERYKSSEAASKIKEYVRMVQNVFGRKPLVIRSDGGGEFVNRELQEFYESEGIKAQFTTPYSPQQNGVAERKNRSLQEMANCLLADANMTKLYWGEAVMTAAYLQNRLPSRVIVGTPYELWTGRKSNIGHYRVFGCEAYVHIPDVKRAKLDQKAIKLRFVGYSEDHKGYRFLDQSTNRITTE